MTPILVRPVREQLEHDRVIRLLQQRWKRKYAVGINQGSETAASVALGETILYPDVVLAPLGKPNKAEIVVEVETGESVNNLEAMAEWARFGRLKAEFHLYLPTGSVEPAKRLCGDHHIPVAEIWTYHPIGDQMRFTMVYKAPLSAKAARRAAAAPAPAKPAARKAPVKADGAERRGPQGCGSPQARQAGASGGRACGSEEEGGGQARPPAEAQVASGPGRGTRPSPALARLNTERHASACRHGDSCHCRVADAICTEDMMKNGKRFALAVAVGAAALSGFLLAQSPPAGSGQSAGGPAKPQIVVPQQPTFKTSIDLVTTDVIPRDSRGVFVSDLRPREFELYEDGVKQEIVQLLMFHGGRAVQPARGPGADAARGHHPARGAADQRRGRAHLHLRARRPPPRFQEHGPHPRPDEEDPDAARARRRPVRHRLHRAPRPSRSSSTYNLKRLDEAMNKITGGGLRPADILEGGTTAEGPTEVRYRAHVAFSTAFDMMQQLEQVRNRRKSLIYISNGYDFDPFRGGRSKAEAERMGLTQAGNARPATAATARASRRPATTARTTRTCSATRTSSRMPTWRASCRN